MLQVCFEAVVFEANRIGSWWHAGKCNLPVVVCRADAFLVGVFVENIRVGSGNRALQRIGHTDFERGFIKAEVMRWDDLVKLGSEAAVRDQGKLRIEGKEYVVHDGDVMHFRFNV